MTYPDHPRHVTKPQMKRVPRHLTENARALRNGATETERLLWRKLSRYRPRFTRQLVVGPYIIDLACGEARLGIELDRAEESRVGDGCGRSCRTGGEPENIKTKKKLIIVEPQKEK